MHNLNPRMQRYRDVSSKLASLRNAKLQGILQEAEHLHHGIGGKSALLTIAKSTVFVKKIPLTDLELLPHNILSTANLFHLPLHYQYGVGSAGFGAWRELAIHKITTDWVLRNACSNFPLLYHSRILPNTPHEMQVEEWGDINNYYHYWEDSHAIAQRVKSLNTSSRHIVLFLEHIPHTLYEWLPSQIAKSGESADQAVAFVDEQLRATTSFMNSQGVMHFDAHFKNILTDGTQIYLSDFGLALSEHFTLSPEERTFLKRHCHYDQAYARLNLILSLFGSLLKQDPWDIHLNTCSLQLQEELSPLLANIIKRYMPIALCMGEFLESLRKKSKSTPYPESHIEKLLLNQRPGKLHEEFS